MEGLRDGDDLEDKEKANRQYLSSAKTGKGKLKSTRRKTTVKDWMTGDLFIV